ncbi:MAG TPA: hypothetical protein VLH79_02540 [Chthonomonadales bacterium]|nr:hypothetical protein [Chthonomonadales bacterium]
MLATLMCRVVVVLVIAALVAFAPLSPGDPSTPWRLVIAVLVVVFGIGKALYDTLFYDRHRS